MKIKFVDGFKIRNTIDPDFCDIGDNFSFLWIPRGEIWVDANYSSELKFNLKTRQLRDKLIKKEKMTFEEAKTAVRRLYQKKGAIAKKIKLIKKLSGVKVWLVDGKQTRKDLDPFFVAGGHGYVYPYIPKNEIWIDNKIEPKERKYIIIHEWREWQIMKNSKDKNFYRKYANAHDFATAFEKEARRKDGAHYPSD